MNFRAVQWNVGGSLIRREEDAPTIRDSYTTESVGYIVDQLGGYDADVVTLQEAHSDEERVQAEEIARELGFQTWINDRYAPSHLVEGQWLGHAILSKFPRVEVGGESSNTFTPLTPRDWQAQQDNGDIWHWMNKGVSVVKLALSGGAELAVATLHLPVFKRLGVDPSSSEAHSVLREAQHIIARRVGGTALLQGDFNIDGASMRGYFHDLFVCNFKERIQLAPTTPKGHRFDHVMTRGLEIVHSEVDITVLTDHYPLITDLEVA